MEFIYQCIDYLKANPTLAYVLIAAAAAILILLVVIIALSVKRSKAKKRATKEAKQKDKVKAETQTSTPQPAKPTQMSAEEEKAAKEAARKATWERLEREEREEAERVAAEKAAKEAEEKAAKEAEEKAKKQAEKTTAKKSAPKKTAKNPQTKAEVKAEAKEAPASEQDEIAKAVAERSEKEHAQKLKRDKAAAERAKAKKQAAVQKALGDDEDETEKAARYSGKWTVCRVVTDAESGEDETYFFELHASNGEKLLSSEEYTSYNGALRGIETHKANIEKGNFKITLSKKGDYIFKLLSGKNMLLCMGENYPTRARCENAIESTKRFAKTAVLDENVQDHLVKVPVEDDAEATPIVENANGKWVITSHKDADGNDAYYFELFANNGEKLLSSEEYTTYIGAVNGIQTHKTNIEKNNFRISLTKRGDYIYKLLNGNGQLLCLGEHYKTKSRCQNAVESVQRFAANSPVLTDPSLTK